MLICPYCLNDVSDDMSGCCGESSAHFNEVKECPRCKIETNDMNPIVDGKCHYCGIEEENCYDYEEQLSGLATTREASYGI